MRFDEMPTTALVPPLAPGRTAGRDEMVWLAADAERHRAAGRSVVVVQGLGFVGAAVAAVVAAARDAADAPRYFVIGLDTPTPAGRAKAAHVAAGRSPIDSPDPELARLLARAARDDGNLRATVDERALALADVVVVDVPLDAQLVPAEAPEHTRATETCLRVDLPGLTTALRAIGRHMRADALVLVETTVPVGACEHIVTPVLREERARRGIQAAPCVAHAYERVTPGRQHVDSIRRYWRVYAGIDAAAAARARDFLASFTETGSYPLTELADPASSELAKLLENSYRALTIALMHEWALLAERAGVNLFAVVAAIRQRVGTHDNMRTPGFGVGGYCLTKDALLAQWSATTHFGGGLELELSLAALRVNAAMPLHALTLLEELADGALAGRAVLVCGISYRPEVGDTRHSPAETLVDALLAAGAQVVTHDPYARHWPERPAVPQEASLARALRRADAIVFAVAHPEYRALGAAALVAGVTRPPVVVDASDTLDDATAVALHAAGVRLLGVGKGHWRRRGLQCAR